MFKTGAPDDEWMERLRARNFTSDTVFPDTSMENLKRKLLPYGGCAVVLAHPEPHLHQIFERGVIQDGGSAVLRPMARSSCHENAFRLWKENPDNVQIWTGWSLSDDGLWRQHSWAKSEGRIIETTTPRVAYFGFELNAQEAKLFGPE